MLSGVILSLLLVQGQAQPRFSPVGRWFAEVQLGTQSAFERVPRSVSFGIEISRAGDGLTATLVNGRVRTPFSSAVWSRDQIVLEIAQFNATITATPKENGLVGTYTRGGQKLTFTASLTAPAIDTPSASKPSRVSGAWGIEVYFPNRADSMTQVLALLRQDGSTLAGTIVSTDGDWGPLSGTVNGDHVVLQSFSGALVYRFDGDLHADQTISGELLMGYVETIPGDDRRRGGSHPWKARRLNGTIARDWTEAGFSSLRAAPRAGDAGFGVWRAETVEGRFIDDRTSDVFAHKAHVLFFMQPHTLSAHEELPILRDLYSRHHARGVEMAAVAFLPRREMESPKRARDEAVRFFTTYRTGFSMLIGTEFPREYPGTKRPPLTFFFDRSHSLVRTLIGFEGPMTGSRHLAMVREMEATIDLILK